MPQIRAAMGLPAEQVHRLLGAAGRAASVHNTQPWRFRLTDAAIELYADPDRQLIVADPDGVELRVSCGAALFNLRVALAGVGVRPIVERMPSGSHGPLARVRNGGPKPPTPDDVVLSRAIPHRRTNRRPFTEQGVSAGHQHELRRAAQHEGAVLHIVSDPARRAELGALSSLAHRTQLANPAFTAELARWTGHDGDRTDGVPADTGAPQGGPRDAWVLRDFTRDRRPAPGAHRGFEPEPLIAVLAAHAAGPLGDLRAGEALEHVLLTAAAHGLSVSLVSQLVELPDAREATRLAVRGARPPQAVLRIGYGWPVGTSPRRPVEELLVADPAAVGAAGFAPEGNPLDPHDRGRLW